MSDVPQHYPAGPARAALLALADDRGATLTEIGEALRLPRRTLHRILASSWLRWDTADRVAIALGRHPSEIWPEWFTPTLDTEKP